MILSYKTHLLIFISLFSIFHIFLCLDQIGKYEETKIHEYYSLTNNGKCYSIFTINGNAYGLINDGECNPDIKHHKGNLTGHMYFKGS